MIFWANENPTNEEVPLDRVITAELDLGPKNHGINVYLYKDINDNTALKTIEGLRYASFKASEFKIDGVNVPVILHINSGGGLATSAFLVVDYIRGLKNKGIDVYTVVEGVCASAATLISTSGVKRLITPNSFMLIHQISLGGWGKYEEFKDLMENASLMMDKIKEHYRKYTRFPEEELENLLKRDLLLDAKHCIEFGLADEII